MKIAVITPYYRESLGQLARCHDSVRAQSIPARHVMVADGEPRAELDGWTLQHIVLPVNHDDFGGIPRMTGGLWAEAQGFDAIQWLDADCWLRPHHLERMVATRRQSGAAFVTATRSLHRYDGSEMTPVDAESDGDAFCDTNCMFFTRAAFWTIPLWGQVDPGTNDRLVWAAVRARLETGHCAEPTVCYTASHHFMYVAAGEAAPDGAKASLLFQGRTIIGRYDSARNLFTATGADGRSLLFHVDGKPTDAIMPRVARR